MPSILLLVFLVELAVQIVNSLGAATISNALWDLYNHIPSKRSADAAEVRKLQTEYLKIRRDLHATSSQDEFAKWARLRRQHDKMLEDLEKKKKSLEAGRRAFDTAVTILRIALTRGLQYFLPFWYAREPMFWLPHGWFPTYAEWLLAFPRAPRGSVGITSWQLACMGVLQLLKDTTLALFRLAISLRAGKEPAAAAAGSTEKEELATKKTKAQPQTAAGEAGTRKDQ